MLTSSPINQRAVYPKTARLQVCVLKERTWTRSVEAVMSDVLACGLTAECFKARERPTRGCVDSSARGEFSAPYRHCQPLATQPVCATFIDGTLIIRQQCESM